MPSYQVLLLMARESKAIVEFHKWISNTW